MKKLFNKELLKRIVSVLVFVPLIITPLLLNNYLVLIVYLTINSIILFELAKMKNSTNKLVINIFKLAVIFTFFSFLILQITSPIFKILFIKIILIIWLFDTFSYLGGKIIGGKKLFPKVSSGKTISGLISGVVLTFFLVKITESYIPYLSDTSILFAIIIIIFAFFGDMIASLVKRNAAVKDSGTIMPGHGGLLDRMDSFIGVFFVFNIFQIISAL
mgnify:FL=1